MMLGSWCVKWKCRFSRDFSQILTGFKITGLHSSTLKTTIKIALSQAHFTVVHRLFQSAVFFLDFLNFQQQVRFFMVVRPTLFTDQISLLARKIGQGHYESCKAKAMLINTRFTCHRSKSYKTLSIQVLV